MFFGDLCNFNVSSHRFDSAFMCLTTLLRHSRNVLLSSAVLLGVVYAGTLSAQGQEEKLIATAQIWGGKNGFKGYSFLPVKIHGKDATIVIDLTCSKCDLELSDAALAKLGITSTAQTESLTIGSVTEKDIPVKRNSKPNWSVSKPKTMAPVVGIVGVHFMQRFDVVYDYPRRRVQLYQIAKQPPNITQAWLPTGFTPGDCGKMISIPPDSGIFTGFEMKIDGHPVTGALEMGPYLPKMNEVAFRTLELPENSPRVQPAEPDAMDGNHMIMAHVTDVAMTIGQHMFGKWDNEVLDALEVQELFPENTPIVLVNLSMLRDVVLFNGMSSKQVCIAKP
jgi:hypothetical protein